MNTTIYFVSPPAECFQIIGNELTAAKLHCLKYFLESIWFDEDEFDLDRFKKALEEKYRGLSKEDLKKAILEGEIEWLQIPEKFSDQPRDVILMDVACNSAMDGGREDRFAARLVSQQWTHAVIEPSEFSFLFDMIQGAIDRKIISEKIGALETGWSSLVESLKDLNEPLVLAPHTGFPNESFCPVNRGEEYEDLPLDVRWSRSMERLLSDPKRYSWTPGTFGDYRAGDGLDGKAIMEALA